MLSDDLHALLAAAALTGFVLLAPRILSEAEVRTRKRRPPPQTMPFDAADVACRTDPASGPATPLCRAA